MADHGARLAQMEGWYDSLLAGGHDAAEQQFLRDLSPHAAVLKRLSGRVVDIGGGAGLAARYLRRATDYVVVDPSPSWRSNGWSAFSAAFRGGGPQPTFVDSGGEQLPFAERSFDAAIALWSLNHVEKPERCIREIVRVLRTGGTAYLVLEDMAPRWTELLNDARKRIAARVSRRHYAAAVRMPLMAALRAKLSGEWPLQPDHTRITDRDLRAWTKGKLKLRRRAMLGGFASYEFTKR
jgi:ubiquinone/menaquinone biosynthesis C-methylase UbiE